MNEDTLQRWFALLAGRLGVPPEALPPEEHAELVGLLLDVARDAAHGVARPAAPVSTFLVGYAAGLAGGGAAAVREAASTTTAAIGGPEGGVSG